MRETDSLIRLPPLRRTILISEPCSTNALPYLPYVWAILKTSSETVAELANRFVWFDPIYMSGRAADLLSPYDQAAVDVLGLSCYTWNFALQCQIAQIVKAANPRGLVVAGGPHPDIKNPDFFRRHPYIDIVVRQDGELTFNKLLLSICSGSPIAAISGLSLPSGVEHDVISTGRPEFPVHFGRSPYTEQSVYFDRLLEKHDAGTFNAVWETNRGCPYRCSFCDWGSNTMSKIRQFDMTRVVADAEFLARKRLRVVFLADANFGILRRDLDIAHQYIDFHKQHGGARTFYYSPAKNHPDRALAIGRALAESNVVTCHTLAIQHTDPLVLASMDRRNISAEKQRDVALALLDAGIPTDVQLIIGIPGDSYDRWKNCLSDLMSWGIHEDYYISFFNLLPNAPAADPDFITRWGIRTIDRRTRCESFAITRCSDDDLPRELMIVGSNSFSSDEWVRMNVYASFIRALHCQSLTRLIAVYLYSTHRMSYRQFYELVVDEFFKDEYEDGQFFADIADKYRTALSDDIILDEQEMNDLLGFPCTLSISRSIIVKICLKFDQFFDQLSRFLAKRISSVVNLTSAIDFQRNVIILPSYRAPDGKSFATDHDWPSYFSTAMRNMSPGSMGEPLRVESGLIHADDTMCVGFGWTKPIDWSALEGEERLRSWLTRIVCGRTSASSGNLRSLTMRSMNHDALAIENAA